MINVEQLRRDVVVIGASAGGIAPLLTLVARLPPAWNVAAAAAVHLSPFRRSRLTTILRRAAHVPVVDADDGAPFEPGRLYVAIPDRHLLVGPTLRLTRDAKEHFHRPAIDALFRSAAESFGARVVAVLLSGSGNDGVSGSSAVKAAGGVVLVQDPATARHPRLPSTALAHDGVDASLTIEELAQILPRLARGEVAEPVG